MKLAEALVIRSDLQRKIDDLQNRLNNNASVQEGEKPAEEPALLLTQLDSSLLELEKLISAINHTNAIVRNAEGKTMTQLLAARDCLKKRISVMRCFLGNAAFPAHRTRTSEIVFKSTIPVQELQKTVDDYSAQLRRLELDIQALNWCSDLSE